jgi:glycerol-3-phosphate O-acyltransferase/dihydroxyacetone phosphate acyltransferase
MSDAAKMDMQKAKATGSSKTKSKKRGNKLQNPWLYDFVLWALSVLIDLFFREVHPRGAWKVPRKGPVILVAAPHANQVR